MTRRTNIASASNHEHQQQTGGAAAALTVAAVIATVLAAPLPAAGQTVIDGCVEYNSVALPYIEVQMKSADGRLLDEEYTDADGCYELSTNETFSRYRLKFRAYNAAAKVHATLSTTPRTVKSDLYNHTGSETRTEVELVDYDSGFCARDGEALWLAGEVSRIRSWFASETGETPSRVPVEFPAGAGANKAYYWGLGGGLHIGRNMLMAIYHEYGHFLMDEYASWINVPYYGDDACDTGHWVCIAQAYEVWPYFEAFGHLVGALSYKEIYCDPNAAVDPCVDTDDLGIENPFTGEGSRQWWIGDPMTLLGWGGTCPGGAAVQCGYDIMLQPTLTEGAVAGALWDLTFQDPEGFAAVWQVVTHVGDELYENPARAADKPNPLTAMQFFDTYRELHPDPGPVPYAWLAFDLNFMPLDEEVPDAPVLVAASHEEGVWSNNNNIEITFDQYDDVSGVWQYRVVFDADPATTLAFTAGSWEPSGLQEFGTTTETTFSTTVYGSGEYYLHIRGRDFYGLRHPDDGRVYPETTHYGPILIDLEGPALTVLSPAIGETFLTSSEISIEFEAQDQADLSGIALVEVSYRDPANGIAAVPIASIPYPHAPTSIHELVLWQIPEYVPVTTSGEISIDVWDHAGNRNGGEPISNISIIRLFDPDGLFITDAVGGDLAAADFDGDGDQDLAIVGEGGGGPVAEIHRFDAGIPVLHQTLTGLANGAVAWGDFNLDGTIDLVTTGMAAGGTTQTLFYFQNPATHVFFNQGDLGVDGIHQGDLATGDLDLDGDLDLVLVGEDPSMAAGAFARVYLFDAAAGAFVFQALPALNLGGGGDVELVDFDGDGDPDISIAGFNAEGQLFENDPAAGSFTQVVPIDPLLFGSSGASDWGDPWGSGQAVLAMCAQTATSTEVGAWARDDTLSWARAPDWSMALGGGDLLWGDVDNDGDADLLIMGSNFVGDATALFITHSGGVGLREIPEVAAEPDASLQWCDYDDDGDLDLVVMAPSGVNLYINVVASYFPNLDPDSPANLLASTDGLDSYTFSWDPPPAGDDNTPATSLTYDLQVWDGGGSLVFSGAVPFSNGNTGWGTEATLVLPGLIGSPVAKVRSVDGGFRRSAWIP